MSLPKAYKIIPHVGVGALMGGYRGSRQLLRVYMFAQRPRKGRLANMPPLLLSKLKQVAELRQETRLSDRKEERGVDNSDNEGDLRNKTTTDDVTSSTNHVMSSTNHVTSSTNRVTSSTNRVTSSTNRVTSSTNHVTSSTNHVTSSTNLPTISPETWWTLVNDNLEKIAQLTKDISSGIMDHSHALEVNRRADDLDTLVEEGQNNPTLAQDIPDEELGLVGSVFSSLTNATKYVDDEIQKEEADQTEMIATIVCMSVLFSVVLVMLIVSLLKPSSAKGEGQNQSVAEESTFPDSAFVQHSHIYYDPYRSHTTAV
ncbi:hypothetical protein Hamer_G000445 [Homarus americanus]|uniref:Uncharacterized protein n=1 Tax=Homarus americanus TaxID=6706 RepID=A0A8J5NDG7_HOMAM|nr:hypothetical protein Hamer_G000445 [Homarus americanus]